MALAGAGRDLLHVASASMSSSLALPHPARPGPDSTSSVGFPCLARGSEHTFLCLSLSPAPASGSPFLLAAFLFAQSGPGAGQGGIPRGNPWGCAVFWGLVQVSLPPQAAPHPSAPPVTLLGRGGLGVRETCPKAADVLAA